MASPLDSSDGAEAHKNPLSPTSPSPRPDDSSRADGQLFSQSGLGKVCRLYAQVDFRREMRPIAFVDPAAFPGINPTEQQLTPGLPVIRGAMHAPKSKSRNPH